MSATSSARPDGPRREDTVDVNWVLAHLSDESVRLIEVDVAPAAYRQGHIPGAVLWNIYADLRHPDYSPISTTELEALLSRTGLGAETTVVFYGYGAHLGYWLLRSHGHQRVLLLDGPREQWLDTGRPWSTEDRQPPPTDIPADQLRLAAPCLPGDDPRDDRQARLHRARRASQAEHDGERFWPSGAAEAIGRPGHVPGRVNLPIDALRDTDGHFREADDAAGPAGGRLAPGLRASLLPGPRTAPPSLVRWPASSLPDPGLYAGSWAEWGFLPRTPRWKRARASGRTCPEAVIGCAALCDRQRCLPDRLRRMRMVRVLIVAVIVYAAAGLVLLGRATAGGGVSAESVTTREAGAYEHGLGDGVAEGRELQATLSLHGVSRRRARAAYRDGYVAGQNDALGGFDGGWRLGTAYVVSVAGRARRDHVPHRLAWGCTRRLPARLSRPVASSATRAGTGHSRPSTQ